MPRTSQMEHEACSPVRDVKINISETAFLDLKTRLKNTRFSPPCSELNWIDGMDGEYLKNTISYWSNEYEWREREAIMNELNHKVAQINGVDLHFIQEKGRGKNNMPLLLMQGWPSSFVQMLDIVPLLCAADEKGFSFDVIMVSLPGYPLSGLPDSKDFNFEYIAELVHLLMTRTLGYKKYALRGSDQGAVVQHQLGLKYPESLIGIHRSGITPFSRLALDDLDEAEVSYLEAVSRWLPQETLYAQMLSQRPETVIPGLSDSPAGMASWYLEKFQRWGNCVCEPDGRFGIDRLLDNLSLHWFYNTAATSARLYRNAAIHPGKTGKVSVPTAILMPLADRVTVPAPRSWAERQYNVVSWKIHEESGHFAEWELPAETERHIRDFFVSLSSSAEF